jgi:hypothetical protein
MQPRDQEALELYQANRKNPEIEALLDQFFRFPTQAEYEQDIEVLRQLFARKS